MTSDSSLDEARENSGGGHSKTGPTKGKAPSRSCLHQQSRDLVPTNRLTSSYDGHFAMIETILIFLVARVVLFWGCRDLLLARLYKNLSGLAPAQNLNTLPSTAPGVRAQAVLTTTWQSTLAESSFSLCFSETCILFATLMCQGLDLLDPFARMLTWRISLFLLLCIIILLAPVSFSLILTMRPDQSTRSRSRSFIVRVVLTVLPVTLYLFLLSYIPLPGSLISSNALTAVTSRLVVLGTTILGILSGLGAVSNAWSVLGSRTTLPSPSSITSAEEALERVRSDLRERSQDVENYEVAQLPEGTSFFSRLTSFKGDTELNSLQQEVAGLRALESQMSSRLSTLKSNRTAAEYAESLKGRVLGRSWAVFCVTRVISSISNILFPRSDDSIPSSSYGDIIAHFLAYLVSLLPLSGSESDERLHVDVPLLSKQLSLALVGIIILSSIRVVLRGVTKALRITSRSTSASLMLLTLAQLMGIYLLSTLVQLRMSFPPSSSTPSAVPVVLPGNSSQSSLMDSPVTQPAEDSMNVFTTLPAYSLFGSLFDWSFLTGAAGCALGRWAGGWMSADDV